MNERVVSCTVINRHFQNCETTCRHLSKRLPDNSTIFAAEATAITLALDYYRHLDPVPNDVVVYSDLMFCLQTIESEDTDNPFVCHIMNLLWLLSDKGSHVCFCWIPSHCGFEGNERIVQLAKGTLDHDIDPLTNAHYAVHYGPTTCHHCGQTLAIDHMLLGVCSVTWNSWGILHSWLIEYPLRDNSRNLHSGIPT